MVCSNCGNDNKSTRRFCRNCGHPLTITCPGCGAANDPGDNYCGECGRALDTEAPRAAAAQAPEIHRDPHERRFVAVLFADLVSSTQFAEGRDPEMVRAVLTKYFDRARAVVARFGGTVEKFIGDAVMAVWGATVAHEDDAERAVRAGLELTDIVARIGEEIDGGELALRVGVLTGEASVAPASPDHGFVVGDMVNTAARLQSLAEPGTVVVGDGTYRMLRDAVHFEPWGERSLRGKSEPVTVWRAVRLKTDRHRSPSSGWEAPFVGRQEELRLLKDALHATERAGRARLVSVVGEAGIGKTRLAWEFRKYVGGLAGDVYWHDGRSPAYDQGLTLWALGEMVRQRAGIAETDDSRRSRTRLRTAVAEYVPTVTDQEWIEPRLAALLGLDAAPTGEPGEFFAAVRSFFQYIAERGPTVLVFEDFHWADAGLIDFVTDLVERAASHPILVLTLARPDLLDRTPGWGAGRRNFASAHLGPLTNAEMAELVAGMVAGIDAELVAMITERASGIPLYAVEVVRMLMADGDLVMDDNECCTPTRDLAAIPIPDTVRAVVEARLDRLAADARTLLQDAAVLGAAFTEAGLQVMSGLDGPRLGGLVDSLVHRELLEFESDPRSPERGQYRFVQSMIREVAYGRLTREERRVRHTRAAEFFTTLGEAELAGAAASHFAAARRFSSDPDAIKSLGERASAALSEAADHAARVHSYADGLAMVEQALADTTDPAAQAALWQRAARSASALARHETAVDYATRAFERYCELGNPADVTAAAALLGEVLCHAFRPREAIAVLEPIVTDTSELTEPAAVTVGAQLARAYLMMLRDADAAAMADRVIDPAERLNLIPTIVDTMITRGTALGNMGRMHEAISLLEGANRYAQEHDLPLARMRAANNAGHLLAYDDHPAALEACRAGQEQAERLGDARFVPSFTWGVASYLERDGRFDEAQRLRDGVRDRFELPTRSALWWDLTDLTARVERGDRSAIEPAFAAVARAMDGADPQTLVSAALARGKLNLLTGSFESAYDEVMQVDAAVRFPDHLWLGLFAAAMLGEIDRVAEVAVALKTSPARGRMVASLADAAGGAIAALEGSIPEAVAGFARALSFGYLQLDRGNLEALFATLVGRDVAEARRASDAAAAVFIEAGAGGYLDLYRAGMPPADERSIAGG